MKKEVQAEVTKIVTESVTFCDSCGDPTDNPVLLRHFSLEEYHFCHTCHDGLNNTREILDCRVAGDETIPRAYAALSFINVSSLLSAIFILIAIILLLYEIF